MMAKENFAAVFHGPKDIRIESIGYPLKDGERLRDDEALLAIESVGLCGSDLHMYSHGHIGPRRPRGPIVLGHEGTGTILAFGNKANDGRETGTELNVGDLVIIEPAVPCGDCKLCSIGRYNLCPMVKCCGAVVTMINGTLSKFYRHKAKFCHKLDRRIFTPQLGTLIEPLSVVLHAINRYGKTIGGRKVLVTGAGSIGLIMLATLQELGASSVTITDCSDPKLKIAESFGADSVINPLSDSGSKPSSDSFDVVFECSGSEAAIQMAIDLVAKRGSIIAIGMTKESTVKLDMDTVIDKQLTIKGVFRYAHCFPQAIALAQRPGMRQKLRRLITHQFELKNAKDAFDCLLDGGQVVKVVVNCNDEPGRKTEGQ